ncbi:MAG TPA: hypothetical protein VEU08_02400 [Vicinamibacterales bacterium]|nr:hypothetical protein [Vicinamibacterales bacterium]
MSYGKEAVTGVKEAIAALRQIEPVLKGKLTDANAETARVIAFQAQQRVRRRYGILADHIRWTVSKTTTVAKVGIGPREVIPLGARFERTRKGTNYNVIIGSRDASGTETPTHIAHLLEFGHGGPHPAPPYPFLIPSVEGERENHLQRVRQAGAETETVLGGMAGGLL